MSTHHDATFFIQIEPEWSGYPGPDGSRRLLAIKAAGITQKRPTRPRSGVVVAKLTIRIPDAAFLPLRPEAVVVVPEDMVITSPVEVVAEDPS